LTLEGPQAIQQSMTCRRLPTSRLLAAASLLGACALLQGCLVATVAGAAVGVAAKGAETVGKVLIP
jgi:hypothetical protein